MKYLKKFFNKIFVLILLLVVPSSYENEVYFSQNNTFIENASSMKILKPVAVKNWPQKQINFGQIVAVSINPFGQPVIFTRADRIWDDNTFNESHIYQNINQGPIQHKTIFVLSFTSGEIQFGWGNSMFYMPHGMTIDIHGNYWLTDVALHQVIKLKPHTNTPIITIGKKFQPGSHIGYLCKPTSVAVASTGEFFIADGYCNQRILKYNAAGNLLNIIPKLTEYLPLEVPHGLTLLEQLDTLCIADRENMRIACVSAGLRNSLPSGLQVINIQEPFLGRVFDITSYKNILYAINGPTFPRLPVQGLTIDPISEKIIDSWGEFENPHSIVASTNGSAIFVSEISPNRIWKFILS